MPGCRGLEALYVKRSFNELCDTIAHCYVIFPYDLGILPPLHFSRLFDLDEVLSKKAQQETGEKSEVSDNSLLILIKICTSLITGKSDVI